VDWNLTVAVISAIAGVIAAYFGYVAVRGQVLRRRKPAVSAGPGGPQPAGGGYDAFVSYAAADEKKAEWIADGLRNHGLRVFLDKWIGVGLVEVAEKESAIDATTNGVLLFSRASMNDQALRDEYAVLLQRAQTGGRRFIPVLVDDVDLPPFARIRKPLDLTDRRHDSANLDVLTRAIRP